MWENFLTTLPIMAYGLGGIFVVIGVIALSVRALCWAFPSRAEEE